MITESKEKPLTGKRISRKCRGDNIYCLPFFDEQGFLVALDLSQSRGEHNHLTVASLRFMSNLIESLLKHDGGLQDIIDAAATSSLDGVVEPDIPGIVTDILQEYCGEEE